MWQDDYLDDDLYQGRFFDDEPSYWGNDSFFPGAGDDIAYEGYADYDDWYASPAVFGIAIDVTYVDGGGHHGFVRPEGRVLVGGSGNDILIGGYGPDSLYGGGGDDELIGGLGADVFYFDVNSGEDAIFDFYAGEGDLIAVDVAAGPQTIVYSDGSSFLYLGQPGFTDDVVIVVGATLRYSDIVTLA